MPLPSYAKHAPLLVISSAKQKWLCHCAKFLLATQSPQAWELNFFHYGAEWFLEISCFLMEYRQWHSFFLAEWDIKVNDTRR